MDKKSFIEWALKLEHDYVSNDAVRKQLAMIDLIAIVGPTGVGKTTIIEKLGLPFIQGDVTRAPREGESSSHEYHFRDDYFEMLSNIKKGNYVQFLVGLNGEFYGTRISSYPNDGPAAMAVVASAIPTFKELGFKRVIPIYILPPGYAEWMRRVGTGRSYDLEARMKEARESLPLALNDPTYHFVLNDDLQTAVDEVKTIIKGGVIADHRTDLARSSADQLFGRLGIDDEIAL